MAGLLKPEPVLPGVGENKPVIVQAARLPLIPADLLAPAERAGMGPRAIELVMPSCAALSDVMY